MIADELYSFDEQRKSTPKKKRSNIYRCLTNRRSNEGRNYTNCTSREKNSRNFKGWSYVKVCVTPTQLRYARRYLKKKKAKQAKPKKPERKQLHANTLVFVFVCLFVCACCLVCWDLLRTAILGNFLSLLLGLLCCQKRSRKKNDTYSPCR